MTKQNTGEKDENRWRRYKSYLLGMLTEITAVIVLLLATFALVWILARWS